jgi:2-dehydro-3-deoxyglucarate aldolase/4-hydroxy-2-oxoheptanedioate aldolase
MKMKNMAYMLGFKQKLHAGTQMAGTMVQELDGTRLVKVLQESGCDFMFIDCEHGPYSYEKVGDMIAAADFERMIPIVRVAEIRKEAILKILDLGPGGIMIPAVKSADEVREAIRLMKYSPMGERGFATFKYYNNYCDKPAREILDAANKAQMLIVQIETREAVACVDEIAAIDGVDVLLVGPGDLSLSYGFPGVKKQPHVMAAIEKVIESAKKHAIAAGVHYGDLDDVLYWREKGVQMLMWSSPLAMIHKALKQATRELHMLEVR